MQQALDGYKEKVTKIEEQFVKEEEEAAQKHADLLAAHAKPSTKAKPAEEKRPTPKKGKTAKSARKAKQVSEKK